jgi:hypothetical protein
MNLKFKLVRIADQYEEEGYNSLGLCPYYFKLDHWMVSDEFSIPVGKRVIITGGVEFETSACGKWTLTVTDRRRYIERLPM